MSPKPLDPSDSPTLTRDVGEGNTLSRPSVPHFSLVPSQTFGPYRIHRLLGKGGMGEVYEAEQRETGRRVALKVLADPDPLPEARERFLREGRLAAAVNHPNSVYIYGTEEIDGQWAISMELLAGGSLKDRMREKGPLPPQEAVDAILQIIDGLEAAASAGVLHRDVKPANCFVERDGTVKIGDFGLSLSTLARDRSGSHLTQSGTLMGTPAFASPEQLRGDDIDVRSDIYSVGATLYYLLTGRAPFEADNLMQLLTTIAEKPAETPRRLQPKIPRGLANVILQCLAKKREGRPRDYSTLRKSLAGFGASHENMPAGDLQYLANWLDAALIYGLALVVVRSSALSSLAPNWQMGAALVGSSLLVLLPFVFLGPESLGERLFRVRVLTRSGQPVQKRQRFRRWLTSGAVVAYFEFAAGLSGGEHHPFLTIFMMAIFIDSRVQGFTPVRANLRTRPFSKSRVEDYDPSAKKRIGPYSVLLESPGALSAVIAVDPVLKRRVWVRRLSEAEASSVPEARGSTRLRWLATGRDTQGTWRAYEAPKGEPLNDLRGKVPWASARFIVRDLARDLFTGLKDGSLPHVLSVQRIWIGGAGTCQLLDFLPPGVTESDDHSCSGTDEAEILRFLRDVATRLVARPGEPMLLPRNADRFLRDLESGAITSLSQASLMAELLARGEISTNYREFHLAFTVIGAVPFALFLALQSDIRPPDFHVFVNWLPVIIFFLLNTALLVLTTAGLLEKPARRFGSEGLVRRVHADGSEVSRFSSWCHDACALLPVLLLAGLAFNGWPHNHLTFLAALLGLISLQVVWSLVDHAGLIGRLTGTRWAPAHFPFAEQSSGLFEYEFLRDTLFSDAFKDFDPKSPAEWSRFEAAVNKAARDRRLFR